MLTDDLTINAARDVAYMQDDEILRDVVHIFDAGWHGIRAACGYCPGTKVGIDHREVCSPASIEAVGDLIVSVGARAVVFQGFSGAAEKIAVQLGERFRGDVPLYAITHVSPAQFEHHFEMDMLARIIDLKREGVLAGVGSVKPGFSAVHDAISDVLIVNPPPKITEKEPPIQKSVYRDTSAVFLPLENTWRKNLYTNFIAFDGEPRISAIAMVNFPSFVDVLSSTRKIQLTGFMDKANLFKYMSAVGLVSNVTLIECQPMTQLEALAVGTPCLASPLFIPEFEHSEYRRLTEVRYPDDIHSIRAQTNRVLDLWEHDEDALLDMMTEHYAACVAAMRRSYREFLGL